MKDPYEILGVPKNATDDEIKAAYRALARKYHPDNYVDNPLADLAQEKMKAINEAYELIQKMRSGGSAVSPLARKVARARDSRDIYAAIGALGKAIAYAQNNVSVGAICQWLLWELE